MFQKRYVDEPDWIEISERITRRQLQDWYKNVDLVIAELHNGNIINTPHCNWRWIQGKLAQARQEATQLAIQAALSIEMAC